MPGTERGNGAEFLRQFSEDYLAESEEHLAVLRHGLLALESFIGKPQIDPKIVDELFRSCHTLKGISGMVALVEAEQIAHAMESYLRLLRQGQAELSDEGLHALMTSTKVLEQVTAAFKTGSAKPDISPTLTDLDKLTSTAANGGTASGVSLPTPQADAEGKRLWRIEFSPSRDLVNRGINVNTVRARLQEIGEIKKALPVVNSEGQITFEFTVASASPESDFAGWQDDGITYSAIDEVSTFGEHAIGETAETAIAVRASSNLVRVDLERLNDLMSTVGDLVMSRSRLDAYISEVKTVLDAPRWRALQECSATMARQLRDIRQAVMQIRMVPIGEIFERMRFVVRDLSRINQKKISLELSGQQTEIDKFLVDRMMDPLLHLVRNAVSHGIEPAEERIAAGKSAEGHIYLRAYTAGDIVGVEIEDDGRGIDLQRVESRARERGLIAPDEALEPASLLKIISTPTFSTQDHPDRESGRGIGLDVVQNTVEELKGTISLSTAVGRGTNFRIQLPLTIAITEALLATVGEQTFAVPKSAVRQIIEVEPQSVKLMEGNEVIAHRDRVLPLVRLANIFRIGTNHANHSFHAFVIGTGTSEVGLAVDRVTGHREIVVRAASDPLLRIPGVGGATEIGDGRVVLILDLQKLLGLSKTSALGEIPAS